MCVYVCVCISLFKYRRIEKVIQGQTLHILSDIYTIGPIKRKVTFSDSTLLNTLGVAYAGAGEPYKAEDAFRRAAEAGVEEARHNLTQVQRVIEQL